MTFGQKIKKLRTESNLTQKDLADKMNVTFQTVSKWENDTNEPDITNIKELAKIFNCSYEYLFSDESEKAVVMEKINLEEISRLVADKKFEQAKNELEKHELNDEKDIRYIYELTANGIRKKTPVCSECFKNKSLYENKMDSKAIDKVIKDSNDSEKQNIKSHKRLLKEKSESKVLKWAIFLGILTFVISLIICILNYSIVGLPVTIIAPILLGYAILADIYCIFSATWVCDVFTSVASWSIKFPGIIFSFSLDGLKFLILMKLLFWILGVIISITAFILALTFSAVCSIFAFPFCIYTNNKN